MSPPSSGTWSAHEGYRVGISWELKHSQYKQPAQRDGFPSCFRFYLLRCQSRSYSICHASIDHYHPEPSNIAKVQFTKKAKPEYSLWLAMNPCSSDLLQNMPCGAGVVHS